MSGLSEAMMESAHGTEVADAEYLEPSSDQVLEPTADPGVIVLVDDDPVMTKILERALTLVGHQVRVFANAEPLLSSLPQVRPDVIVLDLALPGLSGFEALPLLRRYHATVPIIVHTSEASPDAIVSAMHQGAHDYVTKPADRHVLLDSISSAIRKHRVGRRLADLEMQLEGEGFTQTVGQGEAFRKLFTEVRQVINNGLNVLVKADSPNAKEYIARSIHDASVHCNHGFVKIRVGELGTVGAAGALFGSVTSDGLGRSPSGLEQAHQGTLFIDDIEGLPLQTQVALASTLRDRRFVPAGSDRAFAFEARVIAGTRLHDLGESVRSGTFNEELFGLLSMFELSLPPLHPHGAVVQSQDPVESLVSREMTLDELEQHAIEAALRRTKGNVTRAMRQLGIGRTTLYRKLKRYGLR